MRDRGNLRGDSESPGKRRLGLRGDEFGDCLTDFLLTAAKKMTSIFICDQPGPQNLPHRGVKS